jgi:hypothetical protein
MKDVEKKKLASGNHLSDEAILRYKPDPPARKSRASKLAAAEVEKLLANRITDEAILLAANVLSIQDPQGAGLDRNKLLLDAYNFALQAREVCIMTPLSSLLSNSQRKLSSAMLGYNHLDRFKFVPFEEAGFRITGLKTKKQAVKRFEMFMQDGAPFKEISSDFKLGSLQELREHGIMELLIEPLSAKYREYSKGVIRRQNQKNASRPRKKNYRNPKKSP